MNSVHVNLGERSYDIRIETGCLAELGQQATKLDRVTHAVVITDTNVEPHYLAPTVASLESSGVRVGTAVVPAGEPSKCVATAAELWQQMLDLGADRKSLLVALGGGVIGDLAGFIAASFGRGLAFIQVPTTLLAQVDSSVGGKVGINLPQAKNIVGAFWQPKSVLIDPQVLETLPDREYRAGLGEVVKYGVILDEEFFSFLEQNVDKINARDHATLEHVIARSCRLKADVVEQDERELTGIRAVLNYGHTFCHAIESVTGYGEYLHGEAVAIGMLCASRLAESMGRIEHEVTARQERLIDALHLPKVVPDVSHDALVAAMQKDKKVEHGQLRFILPTRMGHVELVSDVPRDLVYASLNP